MEWATFPILRKFEGYWNLKLGYMPCIGHQFNIDKRKAKISSDLADLNFELESLNDKEKKNRFKY